MKFDDIVMELGELGPYQKRMYLLVCLLAVPSSMNMMIGVFTLAAPDHRCAIPGLDNDTYISQGQWHEDLVNQTIAWSREKGSYSSCYLRVGGEGSNLTEPCGKWVYDRRTLESTATDQMDLVCDDKALKTYANMALMAGQLIGSLIMGRVSDMIGRKKVVLFNLFASCTVNACTAFVTSYPAYVTLRFLTTFTGSALFGVSFVIGMELVGPSKRKYAGLIIEMFYTLGLFLLAACAYGFRNWRHIHMVMAVPPVLAIPYVCILPESVRWLISKGRLEEALAIIKRAARVNRVKLSEKVLRLTELEHDGKTENICHLFIVPSLLVRSLIIFYNWLVSAMVYYGMSLNVDSLSGNIFLNFTLYALVELTAYVFCLLTLDKAGRKALQCFCLLVGGLACTNIIFPTVYNGPTWVSVTLSLVGKFGASGAFAVIYVFAAELFPTIMRNSAMGICAFSGKIGGVISPYIAGLGDGMGGDLGTAFPLMIFGALSVTAGLMALLLPETRNRKLPETIEDAKHFQKLPKTVDGAKQFRKTSSKDGSELKIMPVHDGDETPEETA